MLYSALSFILAGLVLGLSFWGHKGRRRPLPPGPRRRPIIGNILDLPRERRSVIFAEWRKTYGDIMSLSLLGRTYVILNSAKAAIDLLDKRSLHYSDKPRLAMGSELVGYDYLLVFSPYGERFRQMRRLFHQAMSPRAAQVYWPVEERETALFLNRLLESPERFIEHIRHTAGAIILKVSHGYAVSEKQDKLVDLAEKVMNEFSLATKPGQFLVDLIPLLKYIPTWFPGASFKRTAVQWRKDLFHMADAAHDFTKGEMKQGNATPSFTSTNLEKSTSAEDESLLKWTAISMYAGGADTTVSSMATFFLAMSLNPQVQVAAQAELDAIVGTDRLPRTSDRPSLPYIEAIFKEVMRWGPAVPGAVHRLTHEDEYNGYRLPAGSVIGANIWGMLHDPEIFPEPSQFRPERFVGPDQVDGALGNPLKLAFGFGRRACPGQNLAEASMFLGISMTLASFTISKAQDDLGDFIEPEIDWTLGSISHPKPFRCEIRPRASWSVELIKQVVGEGGRPAVA